MRVWGDFIGVCKQQDNRKKAGFQGELGAYSVLAVERMEASAQPVPCRTLEDVFSGVEAGALDVGVVPVENKVAGSISETYDLLLEHSLQVTGEAVVPVVHCLAALPGTRLEHVRSVISHPQAISQCRAFLQDLDAVVSPFYDTAGAAKAIRDGSLKATAAIASQSAAGIYGLDVLAEGIQTVKDNRTRFYRVEKQSRPPGTTNKCLLAVEVPDAPGALFMALSSFATRGITLTCLETRPAKADGWHYVFFPEFGGHINDWQIQNALDELKSKVTSFRVLGAFEAEARP